MSAAPTTSCRRRVRHGSRPALNVLDYVKKTSILKCSEQALQRIGPAAVTLGEAEGLTAHAPLRGDATGTMGAARGEEPRRGMTKGETTDRLKAVHLDGDSIGIGSPDQEHERQIAIYDLIEENSFGLPGKHDGPYTLGIALHEAKLMLDIGGGDGEQKAVHILSLTPFKKILRDYFMVCESYFDAIRTQTAAPDRSDRHGPPRSPRRRGRAAARAPRRQDRLRSRHRPAPLHADHRAALEGLTPRPDASLVIKTAAGSTRDGSGCAPDAATVLIPLPRDRQEWAGHSQDRSAHRCGRTLVSNCTSRFFSSSKKQDSRARLKSVEFQSGICHEHGFSTWLPRRRSRWDRGHVARCLRVRRCEQALAASVRPYKLSRTTETRNTCPYCSVACGILVYSLGDHSKNAKASVLHIEGDPDHPVNRGTLCPKGAGLLDFVHSETRTKYPMIRKPGSDKLERVSWDYALDRVARLLKDDRDKNFVQKAANGTTVNVGCRPACWGGLGVDQRDGLPDLQVGPQHGHAYPGQPSPRLTRPVGSQSGSFVRSWRDDADLDGPQERRPCRRDGRQSGRGASLRVQVGRGGQGASQRQAGRDRSALHAHGVRRRSLLSDPARHRRRFPLGRHQSICSTTTSCKHEYVKAFTNASMLVVEE